MWTQNLYSDGTNEASIDGTRVDVYVDQHNDRLSIRNMEYGSESYGNVIAHATFVLLKDVEFVVGDPSNNPHAYVRGAVDGLDEDGEIEWNLLLRMFGNDICDAVYPADTVADADGFEVRNTARMDDHDLEPGDEIQEALYAGVVATDDAKGVSIMLPDDA